MQAVAIWQRAMPDDWRAAQMFLERRHPDRWGKQSKLDVKQEVSGQMEVQHGVDTAGANALLAALGFGPMGTTQPRNAADGGAGDSAPTPDSGGGG
jgi:hypothetical protein